jgi:hypothetical protein
MMRLSVTIHSKPSWQTKYKDATVWNKWSREAMGQEIDGGALSEAEVAYVLAELE